MNEDFNNHNNPFESGSGDWKPAEEKVQNTNNNAYNAQQPQQSNGANPAVDSYFNGQTLTPEPKKKNGLAIASLVLGIVGLCFMFTCCCCGMIATGIFMIIIGVVGIVLGALALKKGKSGMAITGVVLSAITVLFGLFYMIFGIAVVGSAEEFQKWLEEWMQNNYPEIWDQYNSEYGNGGNGYGDILINKIFKK